MQQQLVQQEAEGLRRLSLDREQALARLWEFANRSPEMTRGSITGQVKAISMIVAMENFIPDRLAVSSQKKSAPAPTQPQNHSAACPPRPAVGRRGQKARTIDPQQSPVPTQEKDSPGVPGCPACPGVPRSVPWNPEHAPSSAGEAPPNPGLSPSQAPPVAPYVPLFASVPDLGVGFPIKNPFIHPR